MLSRDCDGCSQMKPCNRRYVVVGKGNCVYCPDGTAHLVDGQQAKDKIFGQVLFLTRLSFLFYKKPSRIPAAVAAG